MLENATKMLSLSKLQAQILFPGDLPFRSDEHRTSREKRPETVQRETPQWQTCWLCIRSVVLKYNQRLGGYSSSSQTTVKLNTCHFAVSRRFGIRHSQHAIQNGKISGYLRYSMRETVWCKPRLSAHSDL
jgi:hypothetical protein